MPGIVVLVITVSFWRIVVVVLKDNSYITIGNLLVWYGEGVSCSARPSPGDSYGVVGVFGDAMFETCRLIGRDYCFAIFPECIIPSKKSKRSPKVL